MLIATKSSNIVLRSCLSQLVLLVLASVPLAAQTGVRHLPTTRASEIAPAQREVPYFVDVAGPEFNPEQEVISANDVWRVPRSEWQWVMVRNSRRRDARWTIYLKSDGTWEPIEGDYADRHYPVEYVLPIGYRGAFEMVWEVQGSPPLQIVNDKIQVYVPASGVYQTSSAEPGHAGSVAAFFPSFYFEHDGKRTAIPPNPIQPDRVGVTNGLTHCQPVRYGCYSYFIGAQQDWNDALRGEIGGNVVHPGSTQPVLDIPQPKGQPAVSPKEFHGRTLNGRSVVLSVDDDGITSWRYDGPEPDVPNEAALTADLQTYIKAALTKEINIKAAGLECNLAQVTNLLRLSLAGPYRFLRSPHSTEVKAEFLAPDQQNNAESYDGLVFVWGKQGWRLVDVIFPRGGGKRNDSVPTVPSEISAFAGMASIREPDSYLITLRQDGTWESESGPDLPSTYTAYDLNGGKLAVEINANSNRTWRRLEDRALPLHVEAVLSELKQTLGEYGELLSAGKIEEMFEKTGVENKEFQGYEFLKNCSSQTTEENSWCNELVSKFGETDPKLALKKFCEMALQRVDIPSTLEELKLLRSETPRIDPIVFSPKFEAVYTLPPRQPGQLQRIKRLVGARSTWSFDLEIKSQ